MTTILAESAQTANPATEPEYVNGWKFLTPAGTTESDKYGSFEYSLPNRGQKWSDVTEHPAPLTAFDKSSDCGEGRIHVMNKPDARYAPEVWLPWYVRYNPNDLLSK